MLTCTFIQYAILIVATAVGLSCLAVVCSIKME
jgi:hypothetical protein